MSNDLKLIKIKLLKQKDFTKSLQNLTFHFLPEDFVKFGYVTTLRNLYKKIIGNIT